MLPPCPPCLGDMRSAACWHTAIGPSTLVLMSSGYGIRTSHRPETVRHGAGIVDQGGHAAQLGVDAMKQRNHFIFDADISPHSNRLGTQATDLFQNAQAAFSSER